MSREPFPGYPTFLEAAAIRLGCPETAGPARRITALSSMSNLCAQATVACQLNATGILEKASEFHDQLRVASLAAELMMADVRQGLGLKDASDEVPSTTTSRRQPSSKRNADG